MRILFIAMLFFFSTISLTVFAQNNTFVSNVSSNSEMNVRNIIRNMTAEYHMDNEQQTALKKLCLTTFENFKNSKSNKRSVQISYFHTEMKAILKSDHYHHYQFSYKTKIESMLNALFDSAD